MLHSYLQLKLEAFRLLQLKLEAIQKLLQLKLEPIQKYF
jgi:hypothetical protein